MATTQQSANHRVSTVANCPNHVCRIIKVEKRVGDFDIPWEIIELNGV
jgi:hypothetical protein